MDRLDGTARSRGAGKTPGKVASEPPDATTGGIAGPTAESWVQVGRIGRPFGLRGEVVVHVYGDSPARFAVGARVFVRTPAGRVPARVRSARDMGTKYVAAFEGIARIEDVRAWVGCEAEIPVTELPPLEEGRYYHFQLIGLRVLDAGGRELGVLEEILATPGNDVYCVRRDGRELLVPAIAEAIAAIDLRAGTLTLTDLPGLVEP